jgi:hypothetical protein
MPNFIVRRAVWALACLSALALAPLRAGETPEFNPAFPWINGGPYSLANVKDKVVVLYFFEAG